ncbi:hypothetical protein GCM10009557_66080 [Virgisporangium ochraceum]|uniref:STAS domain-containing protein n=1 Tax=Virgisporangium ochraceum TaxID=65505 RepID=A0A8J4A0N6_9ACTN|nr:STAS domain-containing protein [Virgisporangium ochraceum]GIJ73036.1 hypothetical protein Voc01_079530 [Virgisporangium ochraceum]
MDLATFEKWQADGVHVVTVTGALDSSAAVQLRLVLYGCADARADRVVIDLARVRLIDASSINVLLAVRERMHRRGAATPAERARLRDRVIALVRSLDRFDPGNGTDFAAYATPTVVGSLRRHFRDHGWMVRPPPRWSPASPHTSTRTTAGSSRR